MLSMLIVEDERWEREGLIDFLDWDELGIVLVGAAIDGIDGYEKAIALNPDIIVTDISMPGMNGLEMARKIRLELPDVRIIVLTGFSDFHYTREALNLDADDYVLKPFELEDIRSSMVRVIDKCKQIKAWRMEEEEIHQRLISGEKFAVERILFDLLHGRIDPHEAIQVLREKDEKFQVEALHVMVVVAQELLPDEAIRHILGHPCYLVSCDALRGAAIIIVPIMEDAHADLLNTAEAFIQAGTFISPFPLVIGTGEQAVSLENLSSVYREALNAARFGIFFGRSGMVSSEMVVDAEKVFVDQSHAFMTEWQKDSRQVRSRLLSLQSPHDELERMFASIRSHSGAGKDNIATLLNGLIVDISKVEDGYSVDKGHMQELLSKNRLQEMHEYVQAYMYELLLRLEAKRTHKDDYIVEKTIRLIEHEYGSNELSLTMLADKVFISINHLGALFKKATGKTVHQYITETRMQKAAELLQMKKIKVSEVAEQIGMPNISHFCSVFKQKHGLSPGEYQELIQRR